MMRALPAAFCLPTPTPHVTKTGKVQVVAVHGRNLQQLSDDPVEVAHEHHMNLKLKSGELRRLLFPVEMERVSRLLANGVGNADLVLIWCCSD